MPCFETNTGYVHLNIVGGWSPYTYQWSNNYTSLQIDNIGPLQESIQITDARGCSLNEAIALKQLLCCKAVLPNAFTPNGDSKNDVLKVLPISEVTSLKLSIYNRWGEQVFSTKNIAEYWDGRFNGVECEMATYFYIMEYNCPFQQEKEIEKGDVTLIR